MTGKNYKWQTHWRRDGALLVHQTGAAFELDPDGAGVQVTAATLGAWQTEQLKRGTAPHDLAQRLMRLGREALEWHSQNQH